jgi:hypothetical protein
MAIFKIIFEKKNESVFQNTRMLVRLETAQLPLTEHIIMQLNRRLGAKLVKKGVIFVQDN